MAGNIFGGVIASLMVAIATVAALVWILDSLARAIVLSRDLEMIDRALAGRPHPDDLKDINAYIAAKYGRPHGRTR